MSPPDRHRPEADGLRQATDSPQGLSVSGLSPKGEYRKAQPEDAPVSADARWPPRWPLPGASAWGSDRHGLWAEMELAGVVQRFRWTEHGNFQMGSPEDEAERFGDEGPQHLVTLTQGLWLADTACTQALWVAVMGSNPSHFLGDEQCPVEQVSWDDVQGFLLKLGALLGAGIEPCLPTEAQWEYACRAGTTTAFSFGPDITPEQVNYDGNYPYLGGKKGLYREKTVAVKSLPPNLFGCYEMHGNVREWCADGKRTYLDRAEVDPQGPQEPQAARAVRGGSWIIHAGLTRSAYRYAFVPGIRYNSLGFRLALRSPAR